ncbi:MAG: citrate synthase [Candidatus Omnitrophica bacterium]|nr:citrate synthase [Candidatus Omnitrophota bacterium]
MSSSATTSTPKTAQLNLGDKQIDLPIITGTENEHAIDITALRNQTGYITMDPGFGNTGIDQSAVTFIDGEKGILRYRGYPIEQLAENARFSEVAYLLIYGELPTASQMEAFSASLTEHCMIHEDMRHFFDGFPAGAHPMAILSSMVCSLSTYYPELGRWDMTQEQMDTSMARVISKVRTMAAFSYKKSIGRPFVYPSSKLKYAANFLNMMFQTPSGDYQIDPDIERALDVLLILHADHEQNCSASTVRIVGSSQANLFASIAAGILALWGPLHGGANQKVIEMLRYIQDEGIKVKDYVAKVKEKNSSVRLMGFGHRIYKNYDPRAKVIKSLADKVLAKRGINDPLLDLAKQVEEAALSDDYFIERKLYPNVDFYTGIIYRAIGIPTDMFTVMFAIGRVPGWVAQWKEMRESPNTRIGRPRQIYTGHAERNYVPIAKRV